MGSSVLEGYYSGLSKRECVMEVSSALGMGRYDVSALKELKWQPLKWLPIGRFGGGKVGTSKKEGSQQESVREPVQSMKGRMKEGMNRGPASLFDGGPPARARDSPATLPSLTASFLQFPSDSLTFPLNPSQVMEDREKRLECAMTSN